jgi:cystathionine beta-lyase
MLYSMIYDFDKTVDRRGTGAIKWDMLEELFGKKDLLPMWVADMEFETPPFIVDAMKKRLEHPVFGYTGVPEGYWDRVSSWIGFHHGWTPKTEWMTFIPGIVKGIGMVINAFLHLGDKVVIQSPVYHPFHIVPEGNGLEVVRNPLIQNPDGSYSMDFGNLEEILKDPACKLFILSNPHNPAGIVWDKETLSRLADICYDHNVLVISDEIHCDMALFGNRHIPFASVSDKASKISITFGAPSKTFNIAGIVSSYAIVPDKALREEFFGWIEGNEFNGMPIFSGIATMAAFTPEGEGWRQQMISYLEGNVIAVEEFCKENLPLLKPLRPQASFLIWLDCRSLGLSHRKLIELFVDKAGLALNDGAMFGEEGSGFMRLNIGCPRKMVLDCLGKLKEALHA